VQQTGHAGTDGSGTETGTAASGTANCNYNKGISGPVRAGIYATATSTREQAGAGYWGILDLSGNLIERCVTVGRTEGRGFTGVPGNGILTPDGDAPDSNWYVANGENAGRRGGSWVHAGSYQRVSDRSFATQQDRYRYHIYGFRGVRTAP
jgi:formylglycine-generating enzyme required for sulfatase activity